MFRNYIFDFDGTLMDTSAAIMATIRATIKAMGLPERTDGQCRSIIGIRTDEAGHHLYPDVAISDEEFALVFRSLYPAMQERFPAKPFPGVVATLRSLRADGHPLAIATSRRRDSVKSFLRDLNILDWFQMTVGAEDVTQGKPNPEPVINILRAQGWEPRETLVVGDADVDILMGKAAGCATCSVTYGNGSTESLAKAHPDFTISSFEEVLLCGDK